MFICWMDWDEKDEMGVFGCKRKNEYMGTGGSEEGCWRAYSLGVQGMYVLV